MFQPRRRKLNLESARSFATLFFFDRDTSFAYKRVEHHLTKNPLQRLHHNVAHPSRRIAVTVGRETASAEAPLFASLCSSRRGSAGLISIVTSHCGRGRSACRNSHQSRARSSFLLLRNMLRNVDRSQACKWPCCSGWTPEFHTLLGDQQHAPRGALRRARFFGAWQLVTPLALRGKAMLTEDTTLQIHDHLSMNGSTDQQKNGM